jgi:glycosyltransferase involved in cell wall biosynthesis
MYHGRPDSAAEVTQPVALAPTAPLLWIDWGRHVRTQSLTRRLGIALLEIPARGTRVTRYARSAARTLATIHRLRPAVVIATNPSLVLGVLLQVIKRFYGFALVSDAHYAGVRSLSGKGLMQHCLDAHNARADLVIVTNESQAVYLRALGCRTLVCADPLPEVPRPDITVAAPERSVFLVCSFDADEPYAAVFEAFKQLKTRGYTLIVSGNYCKAQIRPESFPWVHFLGFAPEAEYYAYLRACSLVMDLTTLEDCLVCGAYESLAAGKPLITSATRALQEYFRDAAIYTDSTAAAIAASVERAYALREQLAHRAHTWVAENEADLVLRLIGLGSELQRLAGRDETAHPSR